MKYRIYIDEVGNPDLGSSENPNHRFLSLTGVILELDYVAQVVQPELETIKRRYFPYHPDEPVVLHRKEIVNARPPFEALLDPAVRAGFDADLLQRLEAWDYAVISVCLDKREHLNKYTEWHYEPYHYCLAALLERYSFFLNRRGVHGDVMAESRGGKADRKLKDSFHRLWKQGTDPVKPETFQRALSSRQLKVKPKANNIAGLQLADLLLTAA